MSRNELREPLIQARNLSKHFGDKTVLRDVSFTIPRNAVYGLIGVSGAGKTTLLRILVDYYSADNGTAEFIEGGTYGFSTQTPSFYGEITVRENILFFGAQYGLRKEEALRRGGALLDLVSLEDAFDAQAGNLSGGMQRRLDIVLSLLNEPDLLILDEPVTGLDPKLRRQMWLIIQYINTLGITVLVSSHRLEDLQTYCSDIAILHDGVIVVEGDPSEVRSEAYKSHRVMIETTPGDYPGLIEAYKKRSLNIEHPKNIRNSIEFHTDDPQNIIAHTAGILAERGEDLVELEVGKPALEDVLQQLR